MKYLQFHLINTKVLILVFLSWGSFIGITQTNIQVSTGAIFEGEPSIASNPTNPQHLIAAWMGFQVNQKIVIKSSVSWNGGTSWSLPIFQPHIIPGYSSADVSVDFDHLGNAFLCYIDFDNVGYASGKIVLRKSIDGGNSWGIPVEVINALDCPNKLCIDRPWMVIDNVGVNPSGTIMVTSMNADQPTIVIPPYNPYVTVSVDGGVSFNTPRYLDTLGFLSGSSINQPMASPAFDGNGNFYAMYPAYLTSQSVFPQQILASSQTNGTIINHLLAYQGMQIGVSNSLLKRAALLKADPLHSGHLAYCFLSEINDQADVYFMETFDAGQNWTSMTRVNQDPINTPRVQDMVWADFNENGDLLVTWRDRRNAVNDGYEQSSEIFAASKPFGSTSFSNDYAISSQQVSHDTILEDSGNDFMSVSYVGDTAYAIWGDVRTGYLKIYCNKWNVLTHEGSIVLIHQDAPLLIHPNPAFEFIEISKEFLGYHLRIYDTKGNQLLNIETITDNKLDIKKLPAGHYFIEVSAQNRNHRAQFEKW